MPIVDQIISLYKDGHSLAFIAKQINWSVTGVRRVLLEHNVTMRKVGRPKQYA